MMKFSITLLVVFVTVPLAFLAKTNFPHSTGGGSYFTTDFDTTPENTVPVGKIAGNLSISGYVRTWYNQPVQGVTVNLSSVGSTITDADGYYEFNQLEPGDYTLSAQYFNEDKQAGLTILDVLLLQKHALFLMPVEPLETPYQYVAAKLFGSPLAGISTFDYMAHWKAAIGQTINNSWLDQWLFVPENYVFPSPVPPFAEIPPFTLTFVNLSENVENANLVAIKPGDLIIESMVDSSMIKPYFFFQADAAESGKIAVEVKATDFTQVRGFQFGLSWDPGILSLSEIEPGALTVQHFNPNVAGELQLLVSSSVQATETLTDSTTLFTLMFNVLDDAVFSTSLHLNEQLLPFQVVVEDCKLAGASMQNADLTLQPLSKTDDKVGGIFSVNVTPHPQIFGQPFWVEINAETAETLRFDLYDTNGKAISRFQRTVLPGKNRIEMDAFPVKGSYLLSISNSKGQIKALQLLVL